MHAICEICSVSQEAFDLDFALAKSIKKEMYDRDGVGQLAGERPDQPVLEHFVSFGVGRPGPRLGARERIRIVADPHGPLGAEGLADVHHARLLAFARAVFMLVLVDLEDDDAICAVPEHVGSLEAVAAEQLPRHDVGRRVRVFGQIVFEELQYFSLLGKARALARSPRVAVDTQAVGVEDARQRTVLALLFD